MPPPARRGRPARPPRRLAPPKRPAAIVSLQDSEYTTFGNWLVYGQSGVGKSVLAGTAPEALLLTTEPEGAISAKARGSTAHELKVQTWSEFLSYMDWLERGKGATEYGWVSLDSLDELEEQAWDAIMGGGKNARDIGNGFRSRSRNDYPLVWSAVKEQVDRLCRLPVNVLITAKTMRVDVETDDEEDTTLALPLVGSTKRGDLAMKICGSMTLVGYYRHIRDQETGKRKRRLHTQDSDRWVAKDRHDTFGSFVDNPNVAEMAQAVQERMANPGQRPARRRRRPTKEQ
jgi:hypothetical protein